MKGIAHFISGVAVATFLPGTVQAAAHDTSFIITLGGAFAILPDFLDFKFARYFDPIDIEIDPNPGALDAQAIANTIAQAMDTAFKENRSIAVQLHTMKLGPDQWRQYSLRFAPETNEVIVKLGPIVSTSQIPYPGTEPQGIPLEARVRLESPMIHTYDAETKVDIFGGPSFAFKKAGESVQIVFLPWHRRWTHSLLLATFFGVVMGLLLGPLAGVVSGLGFAIHILEDQLGYMGSNLFWPLTKERFAGLHLLRSGDGLPNFTTVWVAIALIFFNLDRFSDHPVLPQIPYLIYAVFVPAAILILFYIRNIRQKEAMEREALRQKDIVSEVQELELA